MERKDLSQDTRRTKGFCFFSFFIRNLVTCLMRLLLQNIGENLAEPSKYPNLFSDFGETLKAERFLKELTELPIKASAHPPTNAQRNILREMAEAEKSGFD